VQAWREKQRQSGRKPSLSAEPLQEMIMGQPYDPIEKYGRLPLQEAIRAEVSESVEEIGL
jgi:hypothetical protein